MERKEITNNLKSKYKGTTRENKYLKDVSILFGAFFDGKNFVPVQFEIKNASDSGGRLYMMVSLSKIEADVLERASSQNGTSPSLVSASEHRLTDLFRKVNPSDKHFLKYLPDEMLTDLQKDAKEDALEEDRKRIASYTGNGSRNRSRRPRVARGRWQTARGETRKLIPRA